MWLAGGSSAGECGPTVPAGLGGPWASHSLGCGAGGSASRLLSHVDNVHESLP